MQLSKEKILQTFDIESHESSMVMLLLLQSVFLGIFFGAFDTAANSLFLSVFPANDLPGAFTISGIAGILMTSLYSFLQSRINFNKLAAYNIAAVAVITFIMWFGFKLTTSKWHVFLVLVMMGPLNIIAMLGFWGTAGRIFTLRQGKRLFGLVDAGQIVGVILSSYAIPIILSFHIKTNDILFISTISALVALVFQFVISFRTDKLSVKTVVSKSIEKEHSLKNLMKNKFIRLMAIFVALSMVAAFFVSFSFLAVTKLKYPDETGLAKFFGVFTGTVMFFTLIIKTFVYGKFMKTYGLQMALIISPVLLALLSLVAMLTGMFGGYIASSSGFVFFFLLIAISRLFSVALKSSIEAPSFKILYQTISSSIRYHVQARVDGTINEISALASGLILLGIGLLSFVSLIHYTEVLLVLLIFWIYIAYSLYKAYKKNLDDSLVQIKSDVDNSQQKSRIGIVSKVLQGNEQASRIKFVMNLQEKLQPIVYESLIPYLINHRLDDIKV